MTKREIYNKNRREKYRQKRFEQEQKKLEQRTHEIEVEMRKSLFNSIAKCFARACYETQENRRWSLASSPIYHYISSADALAHYHEALSHENLERSSEVALDVMNHVVNDNMIEIQHLVDAVCDKFNSSVLDAEADFKIVDDVTVEANALAK